MALNINTFFEIDAPRAKAWAILTDIEKAAPCFPGAELTGRTDEGSYLGAFNVRLGPLAFKFAGTFGFASLDESVGHAVVNANGKDVKGRGGARATIDVRLSEAGARTRVDLESKVDLSGAVAQYGRGTGMIEALSQQLVNQFASNLEAAIDRSSTPVEATSARPETAPPVAPLNAASLLWRAFFASLRSNWQRLRQKTN